MLALLLLHGCAVGRVHTPDVEVVGVAFGHSSIECCEPDRTVEVGPPKPGRCIRLKGGSLSSSAVEVISLLASGAVAIFTKLYAF